MDYAIGIDVGGTKIEGAIVDNNGKIYSSKRIPTQSDKGSNQIIRNIIDVVNSLMNNSNMNIKGIGVSLPGFVDDSGKIVFGGGTLTSMKGVNLKNKLEKKLNLPVFIENDANCFALAEAVYGAGKKSKVVLGIIWGTGIGGGIVINKRVYSGSYGGAGEFGHIVIDPTINKIYGDQV